MELAFRLSPGPCSVYRQLPIVSENSSFRKGTSSALEALRDAPYKSITILLLMQLPLLDAQNYHCPKQDRIFSLKNWSV